MNASGSTPIHFRRDARPYMCLPFLRVPLVHRCFLKPRPRPRPRPALYNCFKNSTLFFFQEIRSSSFLRRILSLSPSLSLARRFGLRERQRWVEKGRRERTGRRGWWRRTSSGHTPTSRTPPGGSKSSRSTPRSERSSAPIPGLCSRYKSLLTNDSLFLPFRLHRCFNPQGIARFWCSGSYWVECFLVSLGWALYREKDLILVNFLSSFDWFYLRCLATSVRFQCFVSWRWMEFLGIIAYACPVLTLMYPFIGLVVPFELKELSVSSWSIKTILVLLYDMMVKWLRT